MKKLASAIKKAIEKNSMDGIEGWGLGASGLPGEIVNLGGGHGCKSETCRHVRHSPYADYFRWVPPEGSKLVALGCDEYENGIFWFYWVQFPSGDEKFLRLDIPDHCHASLGLVSGEDIPGHVLSEFSNYWNEDKDKVIIPKKFEKQLRRKFDLRRIVKYEEDCGEIFERCPLCREFKDCKGCPFDQFERKEMGGIGCIEFLKKFTKEEVVILGEKSTVVRSIEEFKKLKRRILRKIVFK